jgi:hypothetical protein
MTDDVLVEQIASRAKVSVPSARAVLEVLSPQELQVLARDFAASGGPREEARPAVPAASIDGEDSREVQDLIEKASSHPLGVAFLRDGYLGSVAATFRTHAFVVEAARLRLR